MNLTGRIYTHLFIQLLTVIFLSLYVYLTKGAYPVNYVWFILALLLGIFGYFRKTGEALWTSLLVVILYGCYTMYILNSGKTFAQVSWNDLIWLPVFPYTALIGGLNNSYSSSRAARTHTAGVGPDTADSVEQTRWEEDDILAVIPGYADHPKFMGKLEEEVFRTIRAKRKLSLLLIEVHDFQEFKEEYGYEQAQLLIRRVAELIRDVIRDVDFKGYLGEGLFAVILTGSEQNNMSMAIEWMDDKFNSLLLSRPRREGSVKARLRYGSSECPQHGLNFQELFDKAKQDLIISV